MGPPVPRLWQDAQAAMPRDTSPVLDELPGVLAPDPLELQTGLAVVVGRRIGHLLVVEPLGDAGHDLVDSRARLVVVKLLVDGVGRLAREVRKLRVGGEPVLAVEAAQTCATTSAPRCAEAPWTALSVPPVQATSETGTEDATGGGCRAAGDPGRMPIARQMAVNGSIPAPLPCTTGMITKPSTAPASRTPPTPAADHRRHLRSSAAALRGSGSNSLPAGMGRPRGSDFGPWLNPLSARVRRGLRRRWMKNCAIG